MQYEQNCRGQRRTKGKVWDVSKERLVKFIAGSFVLYFTDFEDADYDQVRGC